MPIHIKVSKVVVDGVCYCTKRLGEEVAPVIREHGDRWLKSKDDTDGTLSKTVEGAVEVAASGIQGKSLAPLVPMSAFCVLWGKCINFLFRGI